MTNNKLKNSFIFRVVIAAVITAAIIFFPAAALADSEGAADGGSTASEGFEAGGADFNSSPDSFSNLPSEPAADSFTPKNDSPFETTPATSTPLDNSSPDVLSTGVAQEGNLQQDDGVVSPGIEDTNEPVSISVGNSYKAEVTPGDTAGIINTSTQFTITFTELNEEGIKLGSAQVTIPGDFTGLVFNQANITAPAGKSWSGGLVGHVLSLWANDASSYLGKDDGSVSATFTATTPNQTGIHTFVTAAWTDAAAGGVGTTVNNMADGHSNPVVIVGKPVATAADLDNVRTGLGLHYIQVADIDLGVVPYNTGEGWVPIGNSNTRFTGTYNGDGHTISNLFINRPSRNYQGLFGETNGATIKGVTLQDVNVSGGNYTGALAGAANWGSMIEDVHVFGTVSGGVYTGGLLGQMGDGNIYFCSSNSTVTGSTYSGGLVGSVSGWPANIYRAWTTGTITGGEEVGGLVGSLYSGHIVDCYSLAAVTGTSMVGGLVGRAGFGGNIGTITGSYSAGPVIGTLHVGGLLGRRQSHNQNVVTYSYWNTETSGQLTSSGGTSKTTVQMKQQDTFESFNFSYVWDIDEGNTYPTVRSLMPYSALTKAGSFSSGSGSETDPYIITTVAELNAVRDNLAAHYRLGKDIVIDPHQAVSWNYGLGWAPIGDSSNGFTGSLDGDGHTISYLYVNRPVNSYQGLFAYLQNGAVEDLSLSNLYVRGSSHTGGLAGYATGSYFDTVAIAGGIYGTSSVTGGLAGRADNSISEDIHVSGTVSGTDNTGGLVGYLYGGNIYYASSNSDVTGNNYTGGLVGYSESAQIYRSYTTGSVTGASAVGGLVGHLRRDNVVDCYSLASVTGTGNVGGLVGYAGQDGSQGHIIGSYSAGPVVGPGGSTGGLLGSRYSNRSTITYSYWDTQTSGQPAGTFGTGKTTAQMKQQDTFESFNFSYVWDIDEGNTYPTFRSLMPYSALTKAGSFSSGSGSETDPYIITTVAELNAVRDNLAAHYRLGNDIVIDPHQAVSWNYGLGWAPIGDSSNRFTGSLDGDGHTISYLYVNRPVNSYQGLFAYLQNGAVEDLSLSNLYVRGSSYTGALAGYATGSYFDAVAIAGGIYGTSSCTGGLLGYASGGEVTGSTISGKVQGLGGHTGGLVGQTNGTKMHAINLYGYSVIGRGGDGALVGRADNSIIEDVHVSGMVSGTDNTGGLVGYLYGGNIYYASSDSAVIGNYNTGGLVGYSESAQIYRSYTTGSVTGASSVGGLVGHLRRDNVVDCYSLASVTGTGNVGGLVGYAGQYGSQGHINRSYSAGPVVGPGGSTGGLLGSRYSTLSTITNSYWDTQTSGQPTGTFGTGKTTAQMKQMLTYATWDISAQGGEDTVWRIYETSTYPLLRHFFADRATITVSADSRDYDRTTVLTGGRYELEKGKDDNWVHEGTVSFQASSKNAGSVDIILLGVYSNQQEYDLVFVTDGSVIINPRSLTLSSFTAENKVYDGNTTVTGTGFSDDSIAGDVLEFSYTAAFGDKHVGTGKSVNYTGISISGGADQGNYTLGSTTGTATADITPLAITVTALTDTKVYDGMTNSSGEPDITIGSLVGGDTVLWTQAFDAKDVGTGKTITPAGAVNDGNSGNNYAVTFVPVSTGEITVKPITIVPVSGQSKIIGAADPVFTYQHSALIGDDQIAGALEREAGEDLGNYAYTLGTLAVGGNYSLLMTAEPATFAIVEQPVDPEPDPDPDPTPGPDDPSPGDSDPENQFFIPTLVPAPFADGGLTSIPGQAANAIITPAFVTGGSAADLGRAIAAYKQAKQSFEANKGTMSAADKAVADVELAAANAAIIALELSLAFQNGQAVDVAALVAAYQAAQAALNSNRSLLSADQVAAAEALLNAIASVIGRLST